MLSVNSVRCCMRKALNWGLTQNIPERDKLEHLRSIIQGVGHRDIN